MEKNTPNLPLIRQQRTEHPEAKDKAKGLSFSSFRAPIYTSPSLLPISQKIPLKRKSIPRGEKIVSDTLLLIIPLSIVSRQRTLETLLKPQEVFFICGECENVRLFDYGQRRLPRIRMANLMASDLKKCRNSVLVRLHPSLYRTLKLTFSRDVGIYCQGRSN